MKAEEAARALEAAIVNDSGLTPAMIADMRKQLYEKAGEDLQVFKAMAATGKLNITQLLSDPEMLDDAVKSSWWEMLASPAARKDPEVARLIVERARSLGTATGSLDLYAGLGSLAGGKAKDGMDQLMRSLQSGGVSEYNWSSGADQMTALGFQDPRILAISAPHMDSALAPALHTLSTQLSSGKLDLKNLSDDQVAAFGFAAASAGDPGVAWTNSQRTDSLHLLSGCLASLEERLGPDHASVRELQNAWRDAVQSYEQDVQILSCVQALPEICLQLPPGTNPEFYETLKSSGPVTALKVLQASRPEVLENLESSEPVEHYRARVAAFGRNTAQVRQ